MPAKPAYQGADQNRTGVCHGTQSWQRRYGSAWVKRRAQILDERGARCELCRADGVDDGIRVHHLSYERFGNELDSDLQVLCRACHAEVHADERRRKRDARVEAMWRALAAPPRAREQESA